MHHIATCYRKYGIVSKGWRLHENDGEVDSNAKIIS